MRIHLPSTDPPSLGWIECIYSSLFSVLIASPPFVVILARSLFPKYISTFLPFSMWLPLYDSLGESLLPVFESFSGLFIDVAALQVCPGDELSSGFSHSRSPISGFLHLAQCFQFYLFQIMSHCVIHFCG